MRFQRVPGQIADGVPAGSGDSGANSRQGSGGFRGRKLMRFQEVPGHMAKILPKLLGFRCRWPMRFQRVPAQMADEVRKVPGQMADEVPEGCGADG